MRLSGVRWYIVVEDSSIGESQGAKRESVLQDIR
jgi:hypothetical protein